MATFSNARPTTPAKENMEKKRKKIIPEQKLLKGCHQGQNVTVLTILERLEFNFLFGRPTMAVDNSFQCSMALSLPDPFRCPCIPAVTFEYYNSFYIF